MRFPTIPPPCSLCVLVMGILCGVAFITDQTVMGFAMLVAGGGLAGWLDHRGRL